MGKPKLKDNLSASVFFSVKLHKADVTKTPPDQTTPVSLSEPMEAKAKSGASAPKAASKAEKKEPAASRKTDPAPAAPAAPAAPEPANPPISKDEGAESAAAGDEASGTDSLEHLKPFLIGGVVIAAGAILLGVLLLARRN